MARTLITVPKDAKRGDVVEIRTLIAHAMETGHRNDGEGRLVPRDIIRRFRCEYDGVVVFEAELHPAIAANPYLAFTTVAQASGTLRLVWEGDSGFVQTETVAFNVA